MFGPALSPVRIANCFYFPGPAFSFLLLTFFTLTTSLAETNFCRAQTVAVSRKSLQSTKQTEILNAEGVSAFERDDLTSARTAFEKVLSLNQADVTAHTYLGFIADRAGDLLQAERHFSAAALSQPALASARNNYGAILMRTGRFALAAAEFEASIKLDPKQPNALVNLAQIRFDSGTKKDLAQAYDLFTRADALTPDLEIARALTVISLRQRDSIAAAKHYRDYAERLAKGDGPGLQTASARSELGAGLLEAGMLSEAEAELTAALNLDPANQESIVGLAGVFVARKDLVSAGKTLEGAVARGIEAAPIYALLAEVYEQTGHPENAIPAMRLAIQMDPTSEKYRFAYGMLLTNVYAPAAAAIRVEEALKTFPNSSNLWFALGLAFFKNEKMSEAESAFKRSIELNGKFAPAFAYRGMIRVQSGSYAEAIALYEKALELNSELTVVHYLIADALLKTADTDSAPIESHLKRAVESDPTFVPARLSLGKLYLRAQRWQEAAVEFEQVIKLDPEIAESHYQLGRAYMRLKRTSEAQTAMANFKRLSESQKEMETKQLRDIVKRLANVRF
jgi:Tfp pilus assembly protein PilF